MKLIRSIYTSDIHECEHESRDNDFSFHRKKVMGILFDKDRNIALNLYPDVEKSPGETYHLPGGGVEKGETLIEALEREMLEEAGCEIEEIEELAQINEYREDRDNGIQEVYCFTAKVKGGKGELKLSEREIADQLNVVWKNIDEALDLVKKSEVDITTETCLTFLKYFIENK